MRWVGDSLLISSCCCAVNVTGCGHTLCAWLQPGLLLGRCAGRCMSRRAPWRSCLETRRQPKKGEYV